eukprot:TRINITY_DN7983_c0_g1_i1.p1 TRINITY_DN7983_c0_g1~~TRINITY_DN7983_c0_g1_i1.p1  ORF type:complete len:180 (+),score=48.38 TRINITY_DN7983_c0_g1_i1:80-619(+)
MFKWFYDMLYYFNILNKKGRLLLIGLDNAGKTTLTGFLLTGRVQQSQPTNKPNINEMKIGKIHFTAVDLGGHLQGRKLWLEYMINIDAIVYMIDSADQERLQLTSDIFHDTVEDINDGVPVVVFGNKIDDPNAVSEDYLSNLLFQDLDTYNKNIKLFMTSIKEGIGFKEGFEWLENQII